jgi:hypothetical protein
MASLLAASAVGTLLFPVRSKAQSASGSSTSDTSHADSAAAAGQPADVHDVRHYGIVPNSADAAASNTNALRSMLDPNRAGPGGLVVFPNTTGHDVYHFNGVIPIRDGTHIDLQGCTVHYSGGVTRGDVNSGLFFALREFTCVNGTISVQCDTSAATGSGHAIQIGARGTDSSHFTVWDSQLPLPLGNVQLRNLRLILNNSGTNAAGSAAIGILGGVENLVAENIAIDGSGVLALGIQYEFGWATNEPDPTRRQTSHAHNMRFSNIVVDKLAASGIALTLTGAFACVVDGLQVSAGNTAFLGYPGESMFYRAKTGVAQAGVKHAIELRNIVARNLGSTVIVLTGAQKASVGYFRAATAHWEPVDEYRAETNLGDFSLDGFAISGCAGFGIFASAGRAMIRNGTISGCQRGIVATDECVELLIEGVDVLDCQQHGMQLDIGVAIWNPPRTKKIDIRACHIAGNSRSSAEHFPGIEIGANTDSALIENCRFGYEKGYDGVTETTQGDALYVSSAAASNIICRQNHVGGLGGQAASAYHSAATGAAPANGNTIEHATGLTSASGNWITDFESRSPQSVHDYATIITQNLRTVRLSASAPASGVILGPGYSPGQTVTLLHEGAGPNTITFAAADRSHVADGRTDVITGLTARTYVWDAGNGLWYPSR